MILGVCAQTYGMPGAFLLLMWYIIGFVTLQKGKKKKKLVEGILNLDKLQSKGMHG